MPSVDIEPLPRISRVTGTHCIGDLYQCNGPKENMTDEILGENFLLGRIREAGFTILKSSFHKFDPVTEGGQSGYTGMIVLGESHVAIHTRPEESIVQLDCFTCNGSLNNSLKTIHIRKLKLLIW